MSSKETRSERLSCKVRFWIALCTSLAALALIGGFTGRALASKWSGEDAGSERVPFINPQATPGPANGESSEPVVNPQATSGPASSPTEEPTSSILQPTNPPVTQSPTKSPSMPNFAATAKPTLPPCANDTSCQFIMGSLTVVLPPITRAIVNVPGTCQNWVRDWLRQNKFIDTYSVDRVRQRFALALFYCQMRGDYWLSRNGWLSDSHECDWFGKSGRDPCDRSERIRVLDLHGNGLQGTLPPELSLLSALWEVSLSDNAISGTIPSDFEKLYDLDTFILEKNLFHGSIPDFMWEFQDMVHLNLANNLFSGEVPDMVHFTSPNMRVLHLQNNDMSGSIPTTFGSLDWLDLQLNGNSFTGTVPESIAGRRMEVLRLHNNRLEGNFPALSFDFNDARELREVTLHNNEFSGNLTSMCNLIVSGKLKVLTADLNKVSCPCCSQTIPPPPTRAPFTQSIPSSMGNVATTAPTRDRCYGNMIDPSYCQSFMPSGTGTKGPTDSPRLQ